MPDARYDCLIAGAGPAGAAAGILLAQAGHRVLIVEKQAYPRFHVGESLIPAVNRMLKKLGVWERMDELGFLRKYGAEFLYGDGSQMVHNVFANGYVPGYEFTYEVERSRFDQLLRDRAIEVGCDVRQPVAINSLSQEQGGWIAQLSTGDNAQANWLLDGTGRGGILPRHLGLKPSGYDDLPKRFAVYSHFRGVRRRAGREAGNITVVRVPDGWFWSIPIDDERTSVGLVTMGNASRKRPEEIFQEQVESNSFMRDWMAGAESVGHFRVEADYSFRQPQFAGENWFLLGDAACFLDPVFSSGIFLAFASAEHVVELLSGQARAARRLTPAEQQAYHRRLSKNVAVMRRLVSLFYDPHGISVFMSPSNRCQMFAAVNAVIAGHTNLDFGLWWRFNLFCLICRLNRRLPIVPLVELS
ncbi:NAD(P)/FAD-dependent oxidoreductase [Cerasicoccus frondis]|uniref:NAD(P)/FAD-dependent oxidoreductase n=1 Tax=Cerasicoccus frondis TaxID=490090 RepID=UPI002852AC84|nr:NAD(P)/FAD-dependent oxidoreductase [Cerasicoccus frondis]